MAKGYWVYHGDVRDPEAYDRYRQSIAAPLAKHGGRFLVRAGTQEIKEGQARSRTVVIEFPSYEAALACYADQDYQAALAIRTSAADADVVIVEGYDATPA